MDNSTQGPPTISGDNPVAEGITNALAPYAPARVVVGGIFAGAVGAGLLVALNWRRYGKTERFWPTIALSVIVMFVSTLIGIFLKVWHPELFRAFPDLFTSNLLIRGIIGVLFGFLV